MSVGSTIGIPLGRLDGRDKVTGQARYSADVRLPGTLGGAVLRSPLPHARLIRVDTTRARALPGVHAVLTGADLGGRLYGRSIADVPILAHERATGVKKLVILPGIKHYGIYNEARGRAQQEAVEWFNEHLK